jgi:hypothetical protein
VNNAGAVTAGWFYAAGYSNIPYEEVGNHGGLAAVIISLFSIIAVLYFFKIRYHRKSADMQQI